MSKFDPSLIFECESKRGFKCYLSIQDTDKPYVLRQGSEIEPDNEYRRYDKGGDYRIEKYLDGEKYALRDSVVYDPSKGCYILKTDWAWTAPSTSLNVSTGQALSGLKDWKTADGETLKAVNARLGNPLGRNKVNFL